MPWPLITTAVWKELDSGGRRGRWNRAEERARRLGLVQAEQKFVPIIGDREIIRIFRKLQSEARERAETGVRQREFLHALHVEAEHAIQEIKRREAI